jgi:endonuclease/exonuclease/phosphatase family metal-dependent hydrolase
MRTTSTLVVAVVGVVLLILVALVMAAKRASIAKRTSFPFSVMTFNIWLGGSVVGLDHVASVIEGQGADIVAVQEAGGVLGELRDRLEKEEEDGEEDDAKWTLCSLAGVLVKGKRFSVVREWRVVGFGPFALWDVGIGAVELEDNVAGPGRLRIYNVHLPSEPYTPYAIRDRRVRDEEEAARMELDSGRVAYVEALLEDVARGGEEGSGAAAVLIVGDLNTPPEPSWSVVRRLEEQGFVDTWAAARDAGLLVDGGRETNTWTPEKFITSDDEVLGRIDYIFSRGSALHLVDSGIVGEKDYQPWPSDHRAVVSTFVMATR